MTDQLLELLTVYGLPAAALLLALGQFGVPMPTSLALLALGALAANGDADVTTAFAWALAGATLGDQAGFLTGRFMAQSAEDRPGFFGNLARKARKAGPGMARWGSSSVFFTRWLITPLGSAVNILSGVAGLSWPVFTAWSVAGETLWICIYIGLGYVFGSNIETLAGILGNLTLALAMLALAALLGWRLKLTIQAAQVRTQQKRGKQP